MDCQDCHLAESELLLSLGLGDPSEKRWVGDSPVLMGFFVWSLVGRAIYCEVWKLSSKKLTVKLSL
jgi:hypothetical protein